MLLFYLIEINHLVKLSSLRWKARPFLIFRELLRSVYRVVFLWHSSSRPCVNSKGKVSLLDRYQTQIFLAVTGLWGSGRVSLSASKILSNVVVTSHSSCVFLYFFSSANI